MSTNTCVYVMKKGKNKGEKCGVKCSKDVQYCKKHSIDDEPSLTDSVNESFVETCNTEKNEKNENNESKVLKDNKTSPKIKKMDVKSFFMKKTNEVNNTEINQVNEEDKETKKTKKVKVNSKEKETKEKETKEKKTKEKETKETKETKEKVKKEKKEKPTFDTSVKVNVYEHVKLQAKRNQHHNYVLDNDLVVHPVNKIIVGRQENDKIVELSIEDIEYCKENGLRYEPPSIMYFRDSEYEQKEVKMQTEMIKASKKDEDNNENESNEDIDEIDDEEIDDEEESDNEL